MDVKLINLERLGVNTIHLNDSHLVSLDSKPKRCDGRGVDHAQAVTLPALNLERIQVVGGGGKVERIIPALSVDRARVRDASRDVKLDDNRL